MKGGVALYEEQFSDQLKTFYSGVSGYLYCISKSSEFQSAENSEGIFFSTNDVAVDHVDYIPDVYEALLEYEASGKFSVRRYDEQSKDRQNELTDMITSLIIKTDFYKDNEDKAGFIKRYFTEAWEKAVDKKRKTK